MKITWLGHSCFKVETTQGSVVLDPYEDLRVPGYALLPRDLSADVVLCSHEHRDHSAVELVAHSGQKPTFKVEIIPTYHDEVNGEKRGENNIHLIYAEGMKIAHMGDLGCELTKAQTEALLGVDVLMIPVGGFYTIDAALAKKTADAVEARVVMPMHYRNGPLGYEVISTLDEFTALRDNVVNYSENSMIIDADTPRQTAVLSYIAT